MAGEVWIQILRVLSSANSPVNSKGDAILSWPLASRSDVVAVCMVRFLLRIFVLGGAIRLGAAECADQLLAAQRFFSAQSYTAAAAAFEIALSLCPARVPVLISLAQVQYLLGDDAASEKNLKAAIDADPQGTQARYALGRIYYQQKRYPDAEAKFREVIQKEP